MEKRRENGKLKNRGSAGEGGGGGWRPFKGEEQLKLLLSPFPSLPERRELRAAGESTFSAILVQQQNIPLNFSLTSRVCISKISQADSYILVTQITTLRFTESPET